MRFMKTIDECKQLIANRLNCHNWGQVLDTIKRSDHKAIDYIFNELSEMYAREVAGQVLKDAAENASLIDDGASNYDAKTIDKESILSTHIQTP